MQKIDVAAPGGAEKLQYVSSDTPAAGPGQVLVRTAAIGVNFIDTYIRSGVYPTEFPWTPGQEGAGEVIEVGEGVSNVAAGDQVAWTASVTGSYADHVLLEAPNALKVPEGMDLRTAAALPLQGLTVHMLTNGVTTLKEGDTVFITAGAGGVGQLFIQFAKSRGVRVLTMVGSQAKAQTALDAGADKVFIQEDLGDLTTDLTELLREETSGKGVDVFYDGLGKVTFDAAVASVRTRGLIVLFGGASGQVPPFDLQRLNAAGSLFVTRPTVWHYIADAEERAWRWQEISEAAASGALKVNIGSEYPLADAREAHEALEGRRTTGKVVLIP